MLDQYYAFSKALRGLALVFMIGVSVYVTWPKLFCHVDMIHVPTGDDLRREWEQERKTEMDKILERAAEEARKDREKAEEAKRKEEDAEKKRMEEVRKNPSYIIA